MVTRAEVSEHRLRGAGGVSTPLSLSALASDPQYRPGQPLTGAHAEAKARRPVPRRALVPSGALRRAEEKPEVFAVSGRSPLTAAAPAWRVGPGLPVWKSSGRVIGCGEPKAGLSLR